MASALQSELISLQENNYASLAVLVAVGYDYVLTFSTEIEYIWSKPWTWVSTLFILVRYCGLYSLVVAMLIGSSFLPGPAKFQGEIIYVIALWLFALFLGAADLSMILRIWAMYNRSRLILGILLTLFMSVFISTILTAIINNDPENLSVTPVQIVNDSFCVVLTNVPIWTQVASALQMAQGGVMCMLGVVQFARQSLRMYTATKQWQINQYMSLLTQQGVLYFFAIFLFTLINVLATSGKISTAGWRVIVLLVLEYVPVYTLSPRFILSMRELYARDTRGRRVGEIDTAFGLSLSSRDAGGMMVFADAEQNDGMGEVEEIPLDVMDVGTSGPK